MSYGGAEKADNRGKRNIGGGKRSRKGKRREEGRYAPLILDRVYAPDKM